MCREPVEDPHESGRQLNAADLVTDLSLLLSHARFYGTDHRHVEEAIDRALTTLRVLLVQSGNHPIEIGTADGYLFCDQRPLLRADRAAERLLPLLEAVGSGGISVGPNAGPQDFRAFLHLAGQRNLAQLGLDEANQVLEMEGARGLRLLGAYAIGEGPTDFAARALGTQPGHASNSTKVHAVTVPERLYETLFDHLTDLMMRLVRGDLFMLEDTKGQIASMLEELNEGASALMDVATLRTARSDVFQFRHSIRVACLALTVARALTKDRDLLLRVGAAALLHDVGKRFVSDQVLRHNGRLEGDLLRQMQEHTVHGARWLMRLPDADPLAVAAAFGHHRTMDQGGYPRTLHVVELSPATKLIKICDVYEALTAERPYKDPMPPRRAYRIMRDMGAHFDGPLFHKFIRVNGVWPVGSRIRLESGAFGRIQRQTEDLERPVVELEGQPEPLDLTDEQHTDLGGVAGFAHAADELGSLRQRDETTAGAN